MKPLLVFAHRGEARHFLGPSIRAHPEWGGNLYEGEDYFLLICGEGSLDASLYTTAILSRYGENISSVINLGIAGALGEDVPLGHIVSPRSLYAHDGQEMQFTSFQNDRDSSLDLITTSSRVLTQKSREYLGQFGDLVDREAWGIFYACQKLKRPCRIFKLVADKASGEELCQRAKGQSGHYSGKLYRLFSSLDAPNLALHPPRASLPEGFYFSLSQERHFLRLTAKDPCASVIEEVRSSYPEKSPKEKATILLGRLEERANPFMAQVNRRLLALAKDFQNDQFRLTYDKNYASSHLWIKAHIRDKHDMEALKRRLADLPYSAIRRILEGDGDVP